VVKRLEFSIFLNFYEILANVGSKLGLMPEKA
jgi:hypothetical protein